jgi:hypothetical protein
MTTQPDRSKVQQAQREAGDRLNEQAQERASKRLRDAMPGGANLAAALVKFQREMPTVAKSQTAQIPGKDGRQGYSYKYADLADVAAAAYPLLAKHGLAFITTPQRVDGGYEVGAMLVHDSGEYVEASLPLLGRTAQEHGSSLTYNRRYLLGCLTGIITDEDEDGQLAEQARAQQAQVDLRPKAAQAWQEAQESTEVAHVGRVWRQADAAGLLGIEIEHMNGDVETLGQALRRYGDTLAAAAQGGA